VGYYASRGDFYTGRTGYYRGDPGFFSSLGGIFKSVLPVAKAVLGAVYPGAGAVMGAMDAGQARATQQLAPPHYPLSGASRAPITASMGRRIGGYAKAGAGTLATWARNTMMHSPPAAGAAYTGGVPTAMRGRGYAGGGRRKRMNVTNSKALRRAIRRAKGFEKLAKRVLGFASPHKPKGRVYFKAKARKR